MANACDPIRLLLPRSRCGQRVNFAGPTCHGTFILISYEIFPSLRYVQVNFDGQPLADLLRECEPLLLRDAGMQASFSRVYDLASMVFELTTRELMQMVEICRAWAIPDDVKIAWVASPANAGTLKLFVTHFGNQPMRVFETQQAALAWVTEAGLKDLVDPTDRYKTFVHRGSITLDDVLRQQTAWYADPGFSPDKPALWDLRGCTAGSSIKEMQERVPFLISASENAGRIGRTAILVNSRIMEMLIRELIDTSDWRNNSRLFSREQDAIDWLDVESA